MALTLDACLVSPRTPFDQQPTSGTKIIKPNQVKFGSSVTRAQNKWSVLHDHTLAPSTPIRLEHLNTNIVDFEIDHAQNLEVLKHMLRKEEEPFQDLAIVDAIQRLGIDHYFKEDIGAILERHNSLISNVDTDLYKVALGFRLLRQHGYHVPAGVFGRFKNQEGHFKEKIFSDIKGLMALYEASQLSFEGEVILDEARDYSYRVLNSWTPHLKSQLATQVNNTLEHPYHRSLSSFMAKKFFVSLEGNSERIKVMKEIATTDFKLVQSQHQEEIMQISRWWKELGLSKEMKFARDQPLKWHMWSMACLTDPTMSTQRTELTKPISFIYIIDDIFDLYGTLDQLTLFTEVINRWDVSSSAVTELPEYMRSCFNALHEVTNHISYKVYENHGFNPVESLRKAWATLCNAFLVEARWFASGKVPKSEEYLKNGIVSSGVHVVLVHIFFLLGQNMSKESVELINNNPGIISSPATILRLWDDLGSAKDEDQDGNDGSYVECYMKENQAASHEMARKRVVDMISDAWKRLNEDSLSPNPFSVNFTEASLNIARMVPLMYSYDDNHQLPVLEEYMKSHLYESRST